MPFSISANTLKHQAKIVVKFWPFKHIKTTQARQLLTQLYGYKDDHHYQKLLASPHAPFAPITESVLISQYKLWVKNLADLGSMNQNQAKALLHQLWPAYLNQQIALTDKLYRVSFRFYGDCNDFLAGEMLNQDISYAFDDRPSIKDSIEALGIPHTEVGAIQVDQQWVGFEYLLQDGQTVKVFPHPNQDTTHPLPYMPSPRPCFLLDVHLGALARYLRLAGFNCLHENQDYGDAVLAEIAASHTCILLTRDIGLLKRSKIKYGRWIRNVLPEQQFKEVVQHYQLHSAFQPFTYCVKCNGHIKPVAKNSVQALVPAGVFAWQQDYQQCQNCGQVFWKGSHFKKIMQILQEVA
ncbi:Mut7-C RNAse domain-containing protein [Thiofilum flexile]|uniref:Mut7-C RNAse domain-containing protein n=1 Tax=Thiofilum flexile TaxID=125627 RepID=UPI0003729031|nr:Mut7-C RNAse domain-containing protein [Thiofilum flexile]